MNPRVGNSVSAGTIESARHSDDGTLIVKLYGHPTREKAIERIRRPYGDNVRRLEPVSGDSRGTTARDQA